MAYYSDLIPVVTAYAVRFNMPVVVYCPSRTCVISGTDF
jgi:hypothetical protein